MPVGPSSAAATRHRLDHRAQLGGQRGDDRGGAALVEPPVGRLGEQVGVVVGDEPVLDQHRGAHPRPQVVGDVDGHRVEVGLHRGAAGREQVGHVHEQLVDDRAQPSGGQLARPGRATPSTPPSPAARSPTA